VLKDNFETDLKMPEDNKSHQEENKEVSSTQQTDEQSVEKQRKEKVIQPLPECDLKPAATFKLFPFSGDNSKVKIQNWIRMYESLAKRSGWSQDEMKWNMSSYLEDEAFDFFVEHVLTKGEDWQQVKQVMLQRFDQFEIEPYMEFLSHKWSPQIELKEYFKKMRGLGVAAGLKEEEILAGLSRGVPVHLRSELSFVTSLQQWVAIAFCLQQRLDENGNHYSKNQPWKGRRNQNRNQSRSSNKRSNHQNHNMQNDNSTHLGAVANSNDHRET